MGVVRGIRETDFLNNIIMMIIISFTCIFTVIGSSLFLDVDIWSLIIDELDIWSIRIFLVRVFLLCFGLNSNGYVNKTLRLMLKYSHLRRWRNDGKLSCVGRGANVCDQSALAHACVYTGMFRRHVTVYISTPVGPRIPRLGRWFWPAGTWRWYARAAKAPSESSHAVRWVVAG